MTAAFRSIEARVYGRVQGVGFRWSTRRRADELALRGHVANESDGSVTVHASGSSESLDGLILFLARGPEGARVEKLDLTFSPDEVESRDFRISG